MALVNCNECGKQISDTSKSCPHCGASKGESVGFSDSQISRGIWGGVLAVIVGILLLIISLNTGFAKDFRTFILIALLLIIIGVVSIFRSYNANQSD